MRRVLLFALATSTVLLTACPSPPKNGECKTSADCAAQQGFGAICVSGRCVECAADADCKSGFTCAGNKCEPRPAEPVAAPASRPECSADAPCGSGLACEAGKCVSAVEASCADAGAFTVHFGFDLSTIDGDAPATLQRLAACLQKAPAKKLKVDGHCDDRGTTAYNMALGKKRSEAVKKYLADLGVKGGVETNTFGKERPLCREQAEDCWARNRRGEFQIER